jgi:hypothetical protein
MCDYARVEYRYPASRRVTDSVVGLMPTLIIIAFTTVVIMNDNRKGVSPVSVGLVLLPLEVLLGSAGFALIRKAIGDRLVVTGDGLISRECRLISVRATTIPWSSVTSFTVKDLGPRHAVVHAILRSGQRVKLAGTTRRQVDAAATIAEELTTKLRGHHKGPETARRASE